MQYTPTQPNALPETSQTLPRWITSSRAETHEDVSFFSGAALAHLHQIGHRADVPHALLRDHLALRAAGACVAFSGRAESAETLRDAVTLLRPGESPGPAGETFQSWRRAVEQPVTVKALHRALPKVKPEQITEWLKAVQGVAIARAAMVLETVLTEAPRAEVPALILTDATLAQALGWEYLVPILATGLKSSDMRKRGEALRIACHRAVIASAGEITRLANDLERRTACLRAVQPKLRAKGAGEAVELFLSREAVAPLSLRSLGSDRAARRFCDRLVELGAARELTGRNSFRLYGV